MGLNGVVLDAGEKGFRTYVWMANLSVYVWHLGGDVVHIFQWFN